MKDYKPRGIHARPKRTLLTYIFATAALGTTLFGSHMVLGGNESPGRSQNVIAAMGAPPLRSSNPESDAIDLDVVIEPREELDIVEAPPTATPEEALPTPSATATEEPRIKAAQIETDNTQLAAISPVAPTPVILQPTPTATSTPIPATPTPNVSVVVVAASLSAIEQQMLDAHNQERAKLGLKPLLADGALTSVARFRANDMATTGYFSHTSSNGQTAIAMLQQRGIPFSTAAENIAMNTFPDGQSLQVAMQGFMGSSGHRANILNGAFTRVGIAVAQSGSARYYVAVFAGP